MDATLRLQRKARNDKRELAMLLAEERAFLARRAEVATRRAERERLKAERRAEWAALSPEERLRRSREEAAPVLAAFYASRAEPSPKSSTWREALGVTAAVSLLALIGLGVMYGGSLP